MSHLLPLHISLEKPYVVRHWLRTFKCSEAELYQAVRLVGPNATDVTRFLRPSRPPGWAD